NWNKEDHVHLAEFSATEATTRSACLQDVNPALKILSTERDPAILRIRAGTQDDRTAFPPSDQLAIPRFTFLEARLADRSQHALSILAQKQDLCVGEWNHETSVFEVLSPGAARLRAEDETIQQAAELALVEVRNGFPEDGARKCLGTRTAII